MPPDTEWLKRRLEPSGWRGRAAPASTSLQPAAASARPVLALARAHPGLRPAEEKRSCQPGRGSGLENRWLYLKRTHRRTGANCILKAPPPDALPAQVHRQMPGPPRDQPGRRRRGEHGATALADPHGHRVGLDEPVRAGVQRRGPELLHRAVQALGQLRYHPGRDQGVYRTRSPRSPMTRPEPSSKDRVGYGKLSHSSAAGARWQKCAQEACLWRGPFMSCSGLFINYFQIFYRLFPARCLQQIYLRRDPIHPAASGRSMAVYPRGPAAEGRS